MHPRKFVRDSLGFAATQYVARGLLMIRTVVAARLLGAFPIGAWNALQLVMDYGAFSTLGTQQGLDQAVPPRMVEGDPAALDRMKRAGLFNVLVLNLVFAGGALAWMLSRDNKLLDFWGPLGAALGLACIVLVNLSFYHGTLLRSHGNIGAVSTWYFLQGAIGTIVGLALVPAFGAWGLLVGWTLGNLLALTVTRIQSRGVVPIVPRPARESLDLMRIGLPMFVFTTSSVVLRSLDRLIVFKFLGTLALGYYSVAVMALTFMLYLPDSIAYVLYPRLLRDYRAAGNDPSAIRVPALRATRALSAVVAGVSGVGFLLARPAVALVLPKFLPGATAVRIVCFGVAGLAFANLSSIVLMTLGRRTLLIPAAVATTLLGAALDLWAVQHGIMPGSAGMRAAVGITRVAWATLANYTLTGGTLLWLATAGLGLAPLARVTELARLFAPLAIAMGLAFGLDRLALHVTGAAGVPVSTLALSLLAFLAAFSLLTAPILRGLGLKQLVMEFNLPWPRRRTPSPRGAEAPPA